VDHFPAFNNVVYVHIPKELQIKFDSKSLKTFFWGYCFHSKVYHLCNTKKQCIIISRNMTFEEISSFDGMSTTTNENFGLFYNVQKTFTSQ
jgi:hypothetical protein